VNFLDQFSISDAKAEGSSENTSTISALLGGIGSDAINASNAQKIAAVFACINVKANALAVIPIKTYKRVGDRKEEDYTNPLFSLLRYAPNDTLIISLYKKMISQDLDLRGNHYSQIVRNGLGVIQSIHPLVADNMEVSLAHGVKTFKYNGVPVASTKILHIFDIPDVTGTKGISRIEYAKECLQFAKNTSSHGNRLFKNSASPSGSFEIEGSLSQEAFDRLKSDLDKKWVGLSNLGKPLLLEEGLTFKPLDIKNSDAEWLESRKFNREEVAAIFGVPVAMINDAANTAYGNLEQKYLEFSTGTIFTITTILEEQFRQSLLTPQEKNTTVIKFKYNAMLRVDTATRGEYYKTRFNTASITPNQILGYEDENGFDGGDERYLQLNIATVKDVNSGKNLKKGGSNNE